MTKAKNNLTVENRFREATLGMESQRLQWAYDGMRETQLYLAKAKTYASELGLIEDVQEIEMLLKVHGATMAVFECRFSAEVKMVVALADVKKAVTA
jgi:hypothetical protein